MEESREKFWKHLGRILVSCLNAEILRPPCLLKRPERLQLNVICTPCGSCLDELHQSYARDCGRSQADLPHQVATCNSSRVRPGRPVCSRLRRKAARDLQSDTKSRASVDDSTCTSRSSELHTRLQTRPKKHVLYSKGTWGFCGVRWNSNWKCKRGSCMQ